MFLQKSSTMSVFTLSDLASRDRLDAGHELPAKLAVIGRPVAHSASPRMHQAALDALGIGARYVAVEVEAGRVAEAFGRMRDLGFLGCNITVPHKFDALAACDEVDATARDLGAVNTVGFGAAGIRGTNTDGYGFETAVREGLDLELKGGRVLIVGAGGGAGGALAAHCARAGVAGLVLVNRTRSKLDAMVARLAPRVDEVIARAPDDPDLPALARSCGLLVNASSLGLKPGDPSPLADECLRPGQAVFDSVYGSHRSALLEAADRAGLPGIDGRLMLLHQGVRAFLHWFPGTAPEPAMRRGLG